MSARVTIGDEFWEVESWSVDEDSTPLIVGDSSGSVGTFTLQVPYVGNVYSVYGELVEIDDDTRGFYVGTVDTVRENRESGLWEISGPSYVGKLNIYNVEARPIVGTLRDAIRYYFSLAGIPEDKWSIEEDLAEKPVLAGGWEGELWFRVKQLLSANEAELSLTGGVIRIRKPRGLKVVSGFEESSTPEFEVTNLAQKVEVYCYNSREIKNAPVYPKYGYLDFEDIISFSSGSLQEFDLELSVSVSEIVPPIQVTDMGMYDFSRSAFMVSTDNGRILSKEEFEASGGYIKIELGEDTTSLKLWLRGPDKILERKNANDLLEEAKTLSETRTLVTNSKSALDTAKAQAGSAAGKSLVLVQNNTPEDSQRHALWIDVTGDKSVPKTWGKKDNRDQWIESTNPTVVARAKTAGDAFDTWEVATKEVENLTKRGADDSGRMVTRFYLAGGIPSEDEFSSKRQFPALRIKGYGVEWTKEKHEFPTGVSPEITDNEVGETVDNPFIQDASYVSRLGTRLAARYSMADLRLSGTSISIEPTGYNGLSGTMTYDEVQALYTGKTYDQVVSENPGTYLEFQDAMWARASDHSYHNTIGNAAGARIFDRGTAHWFRIREATVTTSHISWEAEVDTTWADADSIYAGLTYNQVQAMNEGLTYQQVIGKGLRK